jgi:hypothetical protein
MHQFPDYRFGRSYFSDTRGLSHMHLIKSFRSKLTDVICLTLLAGILAICLMWSGQTADAQTLAGINGTVTDSTGAVVPEARVIVTNHETGVSKTVETTSAGSYHITDLIPGVYTVKVERQGFKAVVQNNVLVQAAQQSTANATLQTGMTSDTVEVTAPEIALETEQPQVATTIQEKLVQELPVEIGNTNGGLDNRARQIDSYLFLAPGVTGGTFSHRINGGLDFQNEVVFNGIPAVQSETQGYQSYINPPFELVKEFTVLQGAFSAQYGLSQGVAQYQFASGGNALHGDVFGIFRNSFFDAPGPGAYAFNHGKTPVDRETNWGFSVGGPVIVPKLYNGKDKTFWYASIDRYRFAQQGGQVTVPSQAMINGDFSGLVIPGTSTPIPIYVPNAWASNPGLIPAGCNPGAAPGHQFPGNIIPKSCISAVSQSLLGLIPNPTSGGELNNLRSLVTLKEQNNWGFTIDHNLTEKQALHGAFWRNFWHAPVGTSDIANPLNNTTFQPDLGTGLFISYSNAIRSDLVMTMGFGWMGEINNQFAQYPLKSPFAGAAPTPGQSLQYLPGINFSDNLWKPTNWGAGGESFSINRKLGLSLVNNWLYTHGRHTMNFGADIRRSYQNDHECQACAGSFTFNSATTAAPGDTSALASGSAFASYLLGQVDSASRSFAAETKLRNFYIAPYFQDNIKITPRFTVDAGLRWDLAFPFSNDNSTNQLVFFNSNAANPGAISTVTGQRLPGAMSILGSNCSGCVGWNQPDMNWKHFSPRLGFSYQLNDKTVLLSGMSFSFLDTGAYEYGTNKVANSYGNNLNGTINYSPLVATNGSNLPGYGLWDGKALSAPGTKPFTPNYFNTNSPNALTQNVKQGYSELFTVGIQRELPGRMITQINYVHGNYVHLPAKLLSPNQLDPKYLSLCQNGLTATNGCVLGQAWTSSSAQAVLQGQGFGKDANGFYSPYQNFGNDYGSGTPLARALLPYPQFRSITNNFDTSGASRYDALQAQAQKRFSDGLTFLVAYTLSRTMSNTDSGFSTFNGTGLNQFNKKAEWAVANDDQKHVLNISQVYELPIGPGKKYFNSGGIVKKNLVSGWQVSGIFKYASGTPFRISAAGAINNSSLFYGGSNRANVLPGSFDLNWNNYYTGQPIFNVSKWSAPGVWTIGDAARNYASLRNPWSQNESIGVAKKLYFGERVTGELRMEYFNVLNRMQPCGSVNTNVSAGNFGYYSGGGLPAGQVCQGNTPRQGQVFLKVNF